MQANKDLARRVLTEVFNEGRLDVIDELVSPDYVGHDVAMPEPMVGPEAFKRSASAYKAAFPDMTMTIEEEIAEGDTVVVRWTARGTHEGELFGIPATGRQSTVTGITINRIVGGKIVEARTNWDTFGLLQQLGAIPEPARA